MKYSLEKKYVTGVAIPVTALKTEHSCGVGEFFDLKVFGDWAKSAGFNLIQLLPVNDTGFENSPYSALSAFALHPIYTRISALEEVDKKSKIESRAYVLRDKWENAPRLDFENVLRDKLDLLLEIYNENLSKIKKSKNIAKWQKENPWVIEYAVFSYLKKINDYEAWDKWSNDSTIDLKRVHKLYKEYIDEIFFYVWVQYNLESQLSHVSNYLDTIGINLKGDLPILMNSDSCDVWINRNIFNLSNKAGAPPDMFSAEGQNWGFPTYNWENMVGNNFAWWKNRLHQAGKFYHAYRIDHVLGFFRIWSIPKKYTSGSMGYYKPNKFLTIENLESIGFNKERIKWLTEPHVPGFELRNIIGHEANNAIKLLLDQIDNEDLYLFKNSVESEDQILECMELSQEAREHMVNLFHNITLLKLENNEFAPTWFYQRSRAYNSLSDHEKWLLNQNISNNYGESMELWREQGHRLLGIMKDSGNMLVCAEDLGAVPQCVPDVLKELNILGLHVTRWSKNYDEYNSPFLRPSEYKYLSVSTPAVHDSTTVRQWIIEEPNMRELSYALNIEEPLPNNPTPENIELLYKALLNTSSKIAMFQYQDLLALDSSMTFENPEDERINIPGTVSTFNWSYRMSLTVEDLGKNKPFNSKLKSLLLNRREG